MLMFESLKEAIRTVLRSAKHEKVTPFAKVPKIQLKILQSEYNIYFVEPEDEQLDLLDSN
tara:strand:- start:285 stop:464 length:180 start_codon:yes stop_codon:yes gene_type:complete